jgi:hypothetical protein
LKSAARELSKGKGGDAAGVLEGMIAKVDALQKKVGFQIKVHVYGELMK